MTLVSGAEVLSLMRAPASAAALRLSTGSAELTALCVAIVSIFSKEMLFSATHAIGVRCRSPSIIANAYHHRSDALSSVVAVIGIVGIFCGSAWLDPLAAVVVGVMVTRMGLEVGQESTEALLPRGAGLPRTDDKHKLLCSERAPPDAAALLMPYV